MGSDADTDARRSQTPTPVEEDGFSRQQQASGTTAGGDDPWADFNQPTKSFYSSSDESGEMGKTARE